MSKRWRAVRGFEHRLHHGSSREPTKSMLADHASSRVGVVAHDLSRPSPTLRRRVATSGTATAPAPCASSPARRRIVLAHVHHRARHRRPNPHSDVAPIGPAAGHVAASSLGAYPTSALRPWLLADVEQCTGGYRINLNTCCRSPPAALRQVNRMRSALSSSLRDTRARAVGLEYGPLSSRGLEDCPSHRQEGRPRRRRASPCAEALRCQASLARTYAHPLW